MNKANGPLVRIRIPLGIALMAALTGCLGFVGGGGNYGGEVVVQEPDVYLFGGGYDREREVHDYSHRGSESRAVAHPEKRPAARPETHAPAHKDGGDHGGKR